MKKTNKLLLSVVLVSVVLLSFNSVYAASSGNSFLDFFVNLFTPVQDAPSTPVNEKNNILESPDADCVGDECVFGLEANEGPRVDAMIFWMPVEGDRLDHSDTPASIICSTLPGSETCPNYVDGFDGTVNGALQFNGTNTYMMVPAVYPELNLNESYTIALWINYYTLISGSPVTILTKEFYNSDTNNAGYALEKYGQAVQETYFIPYNNSDPQNNLVKHEMGANEWNHYAITYNLTNRELKMYFNGQLVDTRIPAVGIRKSDAYLSIGANHVLERFLNGSIDDLRIYNDTLTQDEIQQLIPAATVCTDNDNDGYFAEGGDCGPIDCNDEDAFFNASDSSYCDVYPYLELNPDDSEGDYSAADFALYYETGKMHTYYIKFPTGSTWTADPDVNSINFGHETSSNLNDWSFVGDILDVSTSGGWDNEHVWAPSVVFNPNDNKYYMFYTGVTGQELYGNANHSERIGIATSTDLNTWTRYPINNCDGTTGEGCVWDCNTTWTSWGEPGDWMDDCRDPNVFWDETNSAWYMVYSTRKADSAVVVGLANSTDLINWNDMGPIDATLGGVVESANLIKKDGYYYLSWTWWTTSVGQGLRYSYTNNIMDTSSWVPQIDYPASEAGTSANEIIEYNGKFVYAYTKTNTTTQERNIRFKVMDIADDHSLSFRDGPYLECYYPSIINPGANEVCNGLDDDCANGIDEADVNYDDCGSYCIGDYSYTGGTCGGVSGCSYTSTDCYTANAFPIYPSHCDILSGDILLYGDEYTCQGAGTCVLENTNVPFPQYGPAQDCADSCGPGTGGRILDQELCYDSAQTACPVTQYYPPILCSDSDILNQTACDDNNIDAVTTQTNCSDSDGSNPQCSVLGSSLQINGDDYSCLDSSCQLDGSALLNEYTCDSNTECSLQTACTTDYSCYYSNSGSYTWSGLGYEASETSCTDNHNNDCDSECDYEGCAGSSHGDSDCPIGLTNINVDNLSPDEGTSVSVDCTADVSDVYSIEAMVEGIGECSLENTNGLVSTFTCNVGGAGVKDITCYVNPTVSYQTGANQTQQIDVQSAVVSCGDYLTSGDCTAGGCDWCYLCENNQGPKSIVGGVGDYCVASGACPGYECDSSIVCSNQAECSLGDVGQDISCVDIDTEQIDDTSCNAATCVMEVSSTQENSCALDEDCVDALGCQPDGLDRFDVLLAPGWNFFSIPLESLVSDDPALLNAEILLTYDETEGWLMNYGNTNEISNLETARGYIAYLGGEMQEIVTFVGSLNPTYRYPLSPTNWTLLGTTNDDSLVGDLYAAGDYTMYEWDGSSLVNMTEQRLFIGEAYWVYPGIAEAPPVSFWELLLNLLGFR